MKKISILILTILLFTSFANAQRAEVTVSLNERFFDSLFDALFQNAGNLEFPIAELKKNETQLKVETASLNFPEKHEIQQVSFRERQNENCNQVIRLQREVDGVKTALRFRQGQISAPIAFSGNYNPPLVGCINFSGVAQTNINLEFDQARQVLIGRASVTDVSLSGTGGIGGSVIARLVQSSIDKKINPIEILPLDKISFMVPIQNSANIRMKATGIRHEIVGGAINIYISYEFSRG